MHQHLEETMILIGDVVEEAVALIAAAIAVVVDMTVVIVVEDMIDMIVTMIEVVVMIEIAEVIVVMIEMIEDSIEVIEAVDLKEVVVMIEMTVEMTALTALEEATTITVALALKGQDCNWPNVLFQRQIRRLPLWKVLLPR